MDFKHTGINSNLFLTNIFPLKKTKITEGKSFAKAAKLYGARAIPQNFLIDPNGKLVGKASLVFT